MIARFAALLAAALVLSLSATASTPTGALAVTTDSTVFVNEVRYADRGPDSGEFVEIAGPDGADLTGYSVVLYDGETGQVVDLDPLGGRLGDTGVTTVDYPVDGIGNGRDAVALVADGRVLQMLSWGGVVRGQDGPAAGTTSTAIGTAGPGSALALTGTGDSAADFTWATVAEPTPGAPNPGQQLVAAPVADIAAIEAQADVLEPGTLVSETVAPSDPAVEQVIEGESLAPSATGAPTSVPASCCAIVWSEDAQLQLDGTAAGETVQVRFSVGAGGRYALGADLSTGPTYGVLALSVDGRPAGAPFDGYATARGLARRVALGEVDLAAGEHTLTLAVTGKAAAATGYVAGLDLLRLRRQPAEGRLTLTPAPKSTLRGDVPVYGWSTDREDRLRLQVDGEDVVDWAALAEGATLLYEGQGIQAGPAGDDFADGIRVRGQETILDYDVGPGSTYATDGIDISGELLFPGLNQIAVFTGQDPAKPAGSNKDDFRVRNVRLVLADGTVIRDPAMSGTYLINDATPERTFTFDIKPSAAAGPTYRPARGWVWDTSTVSDGEHQVSVLAEGPAGATRTTSRVVVDNDAPRVTGLVPPDGARVKGVFTLDAQVADTQARRPVVTAMLDNTPVELGDTLSTDDLADGGHTFTVAATDTAGNTTTATSTFTTVRQTPEAPALVSPADGATGVPTDAQLRVSASDPDGDPLDVTFLRATPVGGEAELAVGGTTKGDPPSSLTPDGAEQVDAAAATTSDDRYADSADAGDSPYQRYDIRVDGRRGARQVDVSWEGRVAPDREVTLSVFDVAAQAWTEVATSRGTVGADTTLVGAADLNSALDDGVVHVLVQARDPFADVPSVADATFDDPSTYDFSLAWVTDTQYLSQGAQLGQERFAEAYRAMNRWIADNAGTRKIAYAAHTGDIINNWTSGTVESPTNVARAEREFAFASETMKILDDAGVPNGVTPGNHDNRTGLSGTLYNRYFPPSRYEAAEQTAPTGEDGEGYYGGPMAPGDNQNHYDLIEAGGQKLIFLYVGYLVGQDEIDWANQVLAAHPDRKAVVLTHSYLLPSIAPDGRGADLTGDDGVDLFEQVVLPNDNVFLTLSGHTHGVALNIKRDVGGPGRTLVEMLGNYQFYEVDGERRVGHLRLLQFDSGTSQVSVNTYSPALEDFNANEFDTQVGREYAPASDEFVVPVDLATRTTSFRTDAVGLTLRTDEVIGSSSVASGEEAGVRWAGLTPATTYAWYARAEDEFGAAAESSAFRFTTAE